MRKLLSFKKMLFIALLLPSTQVAVGQWVKKADNLQFQQGRWGGMSFVINNKIYLTGGYSNMSYQNDLQEYDPATNTWKYKTVPPGPINRSSGIAFVINGKAYVGLGAQDFLSISLSQKNLTDLWEYDAATDKWTQKASLPDSGRTDLNVFVANNKAYIVGGAGKFGVGVNYTNQVWEYDPTGNKWTKKANYPEVDIRNAVAFGIGTKGYVSGGYAGTSRSVKTYAYDPTANTWTQKADFIDSARQGMVSFVYNNTGFVGLGSASASGYKQTFYSYNPVTDKWGYLHATWPIQGRMYGVANMVNNKAYVGCGWRLDGSAQTYFRDWYELDVQAKLGITASAGTNEAVHFYPNPTSGILHINTEQGFEYNYSIYSITGQKIKSGMLPLGNKLDMSNLQAGQYIIEVSSEKQTYRSIILLSK